MANLFGCALQVLRLEPYQTRVVQVRLGPQALPAVLRYSIGSMMLVCVCVCGGVCVFVWWR